MITLAAHQPDLLPYTGFWYKLAKADVFAVLAYEQLNQDGYTRRVKMAGQWTTLALESRHSGQLISEPTMQPLAVERLWNMIRGRYQGRTKYWDERWKQVHAWVYEAARYQAMWSFNLALILAARDWLGIRTPITIPAPPTETGPAEKLLALCHEHGADAYLAGVGARAYGLQNCEGWFGIEGVEISWSRHKPWTGDSILTTIFEQERPMDWVLREEV